MGGKSDDGGKRRKLQLCCTWCSGSIPAKMNAPSVFSACVSVALHGVSRVSHEGKAGSGIGGKAEAERECLATGRNWPLQGLGAATDRFRPSARVVFARPFYNFCTRILKPVFLILRLGQGFRACPVAAIGEVSLRVEFHFLSSYHRLLD